MNNQIKTITIMYKLWKLNYKKKKENHKTFNMHLKMKNLNINLNAKS